MKHNQQTFRTTGHLGEVANRLRKRFLVKNNGVIHRAALRYVANNPDCLVHELRLAEETEEVQQIVDEMIEANHVAGIVIDDLAKPAWMTAAIIKARALSLRQPDLYWVIIGQKKLGPHRLDLIRLWVAQDIVKEDWLLQPEKGTTTTPVGFLPGFWETPEDVKSELRHIKNRIGALPDNPPTPKQLEKLDFYGLPYPQEIRRPRASEILDVFMVLDPATEQRWQKLKG